MRQSWKAQQVEALRILLGEHMARHSVRRKKLKREMQERMLRELGVEELPEAEFVPWGDVRRGDVVCISKDFVARMKWCVVRTVDRDRNLVRSPRYGEIAAWKVSEILMEGGIGEEQETVVLRKNWVVLRFKGIKDARRRMLLGAL